MCKLLPNDYMGLGLALMLLSAILFYVSITSGFVKIKKYVTKFSFMIVPIAITGLMLVLYNRPKDACITSIYNFFSAEQQCKELDVAMFFSNVFIWIIAVVLFIDSKQTSNITYKHQHCSIKHNNFAFENFGGYLFSTILILIGLCGICFLTNSKIKIANKEVDVFTCSVFIASIGASILLFIQSLTLNKREIKKQTAINRQQWVNDFRNETTNFLKICSLLTPDKRNKNIFLSFFNKDINAFSENQRELANCIYKILLLLNPSDFLYKAINETMQLARNSALATGDPSKVNTTNHIYCTVLTELIQCQLKVEWERIKSTLDCEDYGDDYWHTAAFTKRMPEILSNESYRIIKKYLPEPNPLKVDDFKISCVLLSKYERNSIKDGGRIEL